MTKNLVLLLLIFTVSEAFSGHHFFLIRGLTREAGHWGSTFDGLLNERFDKPQITYMDLPGSGIFYDKKASVKLSKMSEQTRSYYLETIKKSKDKKIVVATSLAGMMMLEWSQKYNEDFDAIVLSAVGLKKVCTSKERVSPSAKRKMFNIGTTFNLKEKERKIYQINSNNEVKENKVVDNWVEIQEKRPMSFFNTMKQALSGLFYNPQITKSKIPILVLGSKKDAVVSEECIKKVALHLGAKYKLHETSGHGIPIDAPDWMADSIQEWLEEISL